MAGRRDAPGLRLFLPLVVLAVALTLAASPDAAAAPTPGTRLQSALARFDRGEFDRARVQLERLVTSQKLSAEDRPLALTYLAASTHALGDLRAAETWLTLLFREHPGARVDPAMFLPDFVALAQRVESRVAEARSGETAARSEGATAPTATGSLAPEPDAAPGPAPTPDARPDAEARPVPKADAQPPPPHPGAWRFVPFGAGQFARGDTTSGAFFLGTEAVAFGTAVVALARFESLKQNGGFLSGGDFRAEDAGTARTLRTTSFVAFWVGVGLAAWGITDAVIQADRSGEGPTRAPPRTSSLSLTPGGLSVRF